MKNLAIIYHWWSQKPIEKTFRCPILCSIATFREYNPNIPVYVLDVTENSHHDWSKWEKILSFKAIKYTPYFRKMDLKEIDFYSLTEPSRHIDVLEFGKTIKEDILFYADSDVFFLKPILPLSQLSNKITSPVYTAHFYFDKNGEKALKFIEIYKNLCLKCLQNLDFAKSLYPYCPYFVKGRRLWSEVITYYLLRTHQDDEIVQRMNTHEYANIDKIYQWGKLNEAKSLHLFYNSKTKYDEMDYVSLFNELRDPVEKWLGKDFINDLKPNVKKRLSIYNENFGKYINSLTKNTGNKPFEKFIDEAFAWAEINS